MQLEPTQLLLLLAGCFDCLGNVFSVKPSDPGGCHVVKIPVDQSHFVTSHSLKNASQQLAPTSTEQQQQQWTTVTAVALYFLAQSDIHFEVQ